MKYIKRIICFILMLSMLITGVNTTVSAKAKSLVKISKDTVNVSNNNIAVVSVKFKRPFKQKIVIAKASNSKVKVQTKRMNSRKYDIYFKCNSTKKDAITYVNVTCKYRKNKNKKYLVKKFKILVNVNNSDSESSEDSVYNDQDKKEKHTHKWEETRRVEPTCTKDGSVSYACSYSTCDETKKETLKATGHRTLIMKQNIEGKNTDEYRYCVKCGEVIYNNTKNTEDTDTELTLPITIIRLSDEETRMYYQGRSITNSVLQTILNNSEEVNKINLGVSFFDIEPHLKDTISEQGTELKVDKEFIKTFTGEDKANKLYHVLLQCSWIDSSEIDTILKYLQEL